MNQSSLIETFTEKATRVSARVVRADSLDSALEQAAEICRSKQALDSQMETVPGSGKEMRQRIMAAPNLDKETFDRLFKACEAAGDIELIRENVRAYPGGIDVGLTRINYGIADTGTLVLNSNSEETRLASMLCEVHVAILNVSDLRDTALNMSEDLQFMVEQENSYTAFITGASRTADIERVLAIGVHGPLELVIILVEE